MLTIAPMVRSGEAASRTANRPLPSFETRATLAPQDEGRWGWSGRIRRIRSSNKLQPMSSNKLRPLMVRSREAASRTTPVLNRRKPATDLARAAETRTWLRTPRPGRPRSAVLARRPRRRRVRPRMGSIRSAGCRDGRGDMLLEPDRCSPRSSCTSGSRSRYAPIEGWLIPPIPIRDNGWSRKWGYLFLCVDGVADRFGSIASRRFGPSSNRRPKDTNFRLMHCTK